MWVSRRRWDKLVRRIEDLESFRRDSRYYSHFTVYPNTTVPQEPVPHDPRWYLSATPYHGPSQDVEVKNVLEAVLRHLGIKLRYDAGQPARVKIDIPTGATSFAAKESER